MINMVKQVEEKVQELVEGYEHGVPREQTIQSLNDEIDYWSTVLTLYEEETKDMKVKDEIIDAGWA